MATIILTPGQTANASDDIVVVSGTPVVITVYTSDGSGIPRGIQLDLQRKTSINTWVDIFTLEYAKIMFKYDMNTLVLNYAGTYRITRPDITSYGVNIGAEIE